MVSEQRAAWDYFSHQKQPIPGQLPTARCRSSRLRGMSVSNLGRYRVQQTVKDMVPEVGLGIAQYIPIAFDLRVRLPEELATLRAPSRSALVGKQRWNHRNEIGPFVVRVSSVMVGRKWQ